MDAKTYLESYGWKEGEALKKGGLRRPILVLCKKDTKGLGHNSNDSDAWWERLFDGQLKNLNVQSGISGEVKFETNSAAVSNDMKALSPLYRMFVKGEGLVGTIGTEAKKTPPGKKIESDKKDRECGRPSRKKKVKQSKQSSIERHSSNHKQKKDSKHKDIANEENDKKHKNKSKHIDTIDYKNVTNSKQRKKLKKEKPKIRKEDVNVNDQKSKIEKKRAKEKKRNKESKRSKRNIENGDSKSSKKRKTQH
ncbi:uncharacterized protein PRCAT00004596001 [Priceomyces carsonii]|uniref:uncharacterized protein n=1 Tax=Priceomyces carsonii TaxID=28549 RepID=UPI002EDA1943|nr:unnamed protein product [Priceomyces carsonii]